MHLTVTCRLQKDGYHSKIKAAKTTLFTCGFSASRKFFSAILWLLLTACILTSRFGR